MWATCPRSAYQKHTNPLNSRTSSSDIFAYHADFHEGHGTVGEWQGRGMAWQRHGMCELALSCLLEGSVPYSCMQLYSLPRLPHASRNAYNRVFHRRVCSRLYGLFRKFLHLFRHTPISVARCSPLSVLCSRTFFFPGDLSQFYQIRKRYLWLADSFLWCEWWSVVERLATGWKVRGSNASEVDIFRTRPERSWGPPSLLYNGYRVVAGGKAAGAWHWPLTPSSAEVNERVELYLYSPSWPSWPVLGQGFSFCNE
jgi:hypothetical protein